MAPPAFCSHCHLPLPARPVASHRRGAPEWFCCVGCRTVFAIVGSQGGESGWFLAKLGLGAMLAGNVMMFQFLLYVDSYRDLGPDIVRTTSWIMLGLSLATYLLLGVPMMRSAWADARRGLVGRDLLIALGSLAALVASMGETIRGGTHVYYDSGTMLLVLVTLGAYLDASARERATRALRATVSELRRPARARRAGQDVEIPREELVAGERVSVRAGEEIPTDGIIREGISSVEESAFSGEPLPRRAAIGDRVFAGSIALDGAIVVESTGISESLAVRVGRMADEARTRRAPIAILADRVSAVLLAGVTAVALVSFLARGLVQHQWMEGCLAGLAVLVVACPCALGLATSLATTLAMSRLAERGTLVRDGRALENLARVRRVCFDKTGTLTRGRPQLEAVSLADADLAAAAAVERGAAHPLAFAVVAEAERRALHIPPARNVRVEAGGGAQGEVFGVRCRVGSPAWVASQGIAGPLAAEESGSIVVALGARVAGSLRVTDPLRLEATEVLAELRRSGLETILLSGDRASAAALAGREASFEEALGGLSPADKVARVQGRRGRGATAMVGDGLNDAAALAAADVGIAFGPAVDLSREKADVSILREDLREIPQLLALARRTRRTILVNLAWAFAYNLTGVAFAAAGRLTPIMAAAAMALSSLFVVGNSMRLSGARPQIPTPGIVSSPGSTV